MVSREEAGVSDGVVDVLVIGGGMARPTAAVLEAWGQTVRVVE
jgi:hypothetical protein